jgi:hypothetical protein
VVVAIVVVTADLVVVMVAVVAVMAAVVVAVVVVVAAAIRSRTSRVVTSGQELITVKILVITYSRKSLPSAMIS